jgi:Domain of unknown function DUF11
VTAASADFSQSTIAASAAKIYPLDTVDYSVTVRNAGPGQPNYLQVESPIPVSAMYVGSSPEWKFDPAVREVTWYGQLPPGAEHTFRLTLVAMPETEGNTISARVPIRYDGSEWNLHHSLEVDTRPATGGVAVGGYRVTGCGLTVLGFAALFAVVLLFARRGAHAAAMLWIMLSLGFLAIFVWIGFEDARILRGYRETRCTVLDALAQYEESTSRPTSTAQRQQRTGDWKPAFAVRHGDVVTVTGESPSTLRVGGGSKATRAALEKLTVGSVAPCFVDPADPKRVVLTREIGGAYFFALVPLIGLLIGIAILKGAKRS